MIIHIMLIVNLSSLFRHHYHQYHHNDHRYQHNNHQYHVNRHFLIIINYFIIIITMAEGVEVIVVMIFIKVF